MFTKLLNRALLTALLLGGTLSLQPIVRAEETKPSPGRNIRERMEEMAAELKLTDEQQWKLREEFQYQMEKAKELQGDTNLSREQKEQELKAIRENFEPRMKELLTPEQFTKWQALREKMRAGETSSSPGARNRMEAIAAELKLTDEQKSKLKEVFQGPTEKIKELRADTNLTGEQKIQEFQAIQEKIEPQVKEILTPEQFTKWQAEREKLRAEFRQKFGKQQ